MVFLPIELRPFRTGQFKDKGAPFSIDGSEGLFPFCVGGFGRVRFKPNPTGDTAVDCGVDVAPPASAWLACNAEKETDCTDSVDLLDGIRGELPLRELDLRSAGGIPRCPLSRSIGTLEVGLFLARG